MSTTINLTDLQAIGRYLHGDRWQKPIARDLQVNERTVRHWAAGTYQPNEGAINDLLTLAACKYVEQQALQAANNGLWGVGKLTFTAQPVEWSAETDRAIKERAATIMREMGLNVSTYPT